MGFAVFNVLLQVLLQVGLEVGLLVFTRETERVTPCYTRQHMPSPIRAVIFDFGGVLSAHDDLGEIGRFLAKKYKVDPKIVDEITLRGWLKARVDPRYDHLFWDELATTLRVSSRTLQREYLQFPQRVPKVIDYVRQLKRRGYTVAMLSNQIETWHQLLMKRWRLTSLFDITVTSYSAGVAKPDLAIYKTTLKALKLPANACIYIDDREANLRPAESLGMKTVLATKSTKLLRELEAILSN